MLVCRIFFEHFLDSYIDKSKLSSQLFENTLDKIKTWLEIGENNLYLDDIDNEILAAAIQEIFHFAPAAGGLVLVNDGIVAIERNGKHDLPKGHIEKNEQADIAAMREVYEETAISNLKIIRQLPSSHHCYPLNNQWTLKKTSWFLMTSDDFNPKPQTEEGISKVFLINKDNVNEFLENTYISLRITLEDDILKELKAQ